MIPVARVKPVAAATVMVAAAIGIVTVTVGISISPARANIITIPEQGGMEGNLTVAPGTVIYAGYDFTTVPGATTQLVGAQTILSVKCASGGTPSQSSVTIAMAGGPYTDSSQTSQGWTPSGDQSDSATYQGQITMPDLCQGGDMRVGNQAGPFTADLQSTDTTSPVSVRWHYGIRFGTSWSATKSVVPDPISSSTVPVGAVAGGSGLAGAAGIGLAFSQRRRRRRAPVER